MMFGPSECQSYEVIRSAYSESGLKLFVDDCDNIFIVFAISNNFTTSEETPQRKRDRMVFRRH